MYTSRELEIQGEQRHIHARTRTLHRRALDTESTRMSIVLYTEDPYHNNNDECGITHN